MIRVLCALLFVAGAGLLAAENAAPAALPPPATFFQAAAINSLTFSPNGKYIACLVPYEHRMNLAVIDLEKGVRNLLTNFKDRQATQPVWAGNNRILFRVDDEGRESFALYAVNRDGTDPSILASGFSKAGTNDEVNTRFRSILGRIEGDDRRILVLANITYRDWSDVATLDVVSGEMKLLVPAPGAVVYYLRDQAGELRVAVVQDGQERRVLLRDLKARRWEQVGAHHLDREGWEPIAFDGDNRTLFVWSDIGRRTKAIYRYDAEARRMGELVFADETYDAVDANGAAAQTFMPSTIFDPLKKRIVGLSYAADRTCFHWLDDDMKALYRKLETSLPDTVHRPRQFASGGSRIIFFSSSDRDPGVYYLYDRERQKLSELAVIKPAIEPEKMGRTKAVTFAARDGLILHGYLTLPPGRPARNLPLILHPHGGPFGIRDEWGYRDEVQFYVSRGFAVLQVNYRGSGGYGRVFEQAGFKRWGREMQDDLSDGVKWAVAEGVADPQRVVISGASYGGYAVMAGLAFTPELYCAGINYVGATDIELLIPREAPPDMMYWRDTRLGRLADADDRQRLHDTSPVHFADRIQAPVLMAYGKNDPRVRIEHGFDMERALKKAGKAHEMIIEESEGHGFRMEENAIRFFTKVDDFLRRHVLKAEVKIGPTQVIESTVPAKGG